MSLQTAEPAGRTTAVRSPNRLLARLPFDDYQRILPKLREVVLRPGQVLHKQDETITEVVFPTAGACSLTKQLGDGSSTEVAAVGSEGVIGAAVFFGDDLSVYQSMAQASGVTAQTMSAAAFVEEMSRRGALYNLIVRYNQAFMTLVMQTTACNGLHAVEQRCSRWLLMAHDRMPAGDLRVTHEFLSVMLGVRRPTVTLVMAALQRKGIIETHRGNVRILDRKQLEATACECYRTVQASFARLLPEVSAAVA
jgi:CRP-like cAMP-binding protein